MFIMEIYKYWINSVYTSLLSRSFLSEFAKNFEILYTGNLFWLTVFLIAIVALVNIVLHLQKVSPAALKVLLVVSLISSLMLFSSFIPDSNSTNEANSRSLQTVFMVVFSILHLFITVSLCVISFTVLMKFYIFRSIWITILILLAGYSVVFLFAYNYKDDFEILKSNKKTVDAGTVLGAAVWGGNRPSPVLRERINKGYELYTYGIIKNIILTGGGAPGEMTEAEVSKNELLKKGVNERNIFIENKSNSTLEQIKYLNNNLYKKNNWKEIVIISDNFHLLRTKQICKFFGINAYTVASDTPLSSESTFNFCVKESFAVILFWLFGIG